MVQGASGRAQGTVIEVSGRIVDKTCRPLVSALVEVWQANAAGRYDHPGDESNPNALDPNFQGFTRLYSDSRGGFRFLTIKPGAYAVSDSWWRPPHIHFRVTPVSAPYLVTQMYFAGEELNAQDRLFNDIDPAGQERVAIDFSGTNADGVPAGTFDMVVGAG